MLYNNQKNSKYIRRNRDLQWISFKQKNCEWFIQSESYFIREILRVRPTVQAQILGKESLNYVLTHISQTSFIKNKTKQNKKNPQKEQKIHTKPLN